MCHTPVGIVEPIPAGQAAKDYLAKVVSPTLLRGLTELCKQKPEDPVVRSWSPACAHFEIPTFTSRLTLLLRLVFWNETGLLKSKGRSDYEALLYIYWVDTFLTVSFSHSESGGWGHFMPWVVVLSGPSVCLLWWALPFGRILHVRDDVTCVRDSKFKLTISCPSRLRFVSTVCSVLSQAPKRNKHWAHSA